MRREHRRVSEGFAIQDGLQIFDPLFRIDRSRPALVEPHAESGFEPIAPTERGSNPLADLNEFAQTVWNPIMVFVFHRPIEDDCCKQFVFRLGPLPFEFRGI